SARAARTGSQRRGSARAGAAPRPAARAARARSPGFRPQRFQGHFEPVLLVDPLRDLHFRRDAGALFDAAASQVAAVRREVLADRDVERAAVGQGLLLLEDALAERVRADDGGAPVVL